MGKVIKQKGKDSVIDLEWAVDQSTITYNLLFGYFDEIVNPHNTEERISLSDRCKIALNSLVKSLKMATLLSEDEAVLDSLFDRTVFEIELVDDTDIR